MNLRGCGTALVTPFKADGAVDEAAVRALVAWQVESKIDFLVPCGTTGETPTLSREEWLRVIEITIEVVAGRVPIVAGATSNSTADAVEKAKTVAAIKGVDAILTASPYYNKPTQEGQYQHFKAIAEAVDKPLVLYNVPGRTGANLEPATAARLAQDPQHHRRQGSQRQHQPDGRPAECGAGELPGPLGRRRGDAAADRPGRRGRDLGGLQPDSARDVRADPRGLAQRLDNRAQAAAQVSAADAGELHRVEPHAGEGRAGHDGPDRGELPLAAWCG